MGRKIFVSYKYADTSVKDLNIYEEDFFGRKMKVQTKARHYVDKLSLKLELGDNIYKGEDDGESLANFSDEHIASKLRDKIYDSTVTIVLVSKGMKNVFETEKNQWMPWEISYSLKEITRNGRTSCCNGMLAVVLPDEWGSYEYYITNNSTCNCRSLNSDFLFKILSDNILNEKNPITTKCSDGSTIYHGDSSYIQSIKWEDFVGNIKYYLDKAIEIRDKKENYNITKNLR
ncbi:TIR domain-containing protein [Flavobacterium anhuiense]|uniref:TIR domain-containing protein n=1 Tax=Flavobacterium anhuiense TaxID=459526 RepID=UPI002026D9D8|nr:TIR domain-containing protein [Flavobacterium anhuiense]URM38587.1 TIR domain-containing protein [Flavobacterium anhuiense]